MYEDLLKSISDFIKKKIGENNFRDWFSKISISYNDGYFLIFPNKFTLDWVNSHYSTLINELSESLGFEIKLQTATELSAQEIDSLLIDSSLNNDFTFENFIIANSNEMAYEAAKRIAENEDIIFNPLFIYGNVGLGKTHLMHSIANYKKKHFPKKKIMYLSSEQFMNQFINSLRTKTIMSFKDEFRSIDALLIDDFQFLGKKDATQEEFFHTFNALLEQKKQLIISADQPPHTLPGVEARLKSRLGWGLVVDIHPATYELKVSILQAKANKLNLHIESDILGLIAQKIHSSIRELEGAFVRVTKYAEWMKKPITSDLVHTILNNVYENRPKTAQEILSILCNKTNFSLEKLKSNGRNRDLARARQKVVFLLKEATGISYVQIAKLLGGKDHTSMIYAENKAKELIQTNSEFAEEIESLRSFIS
ncbi:chromosomal replication initiator protein DnaA [Alphaproteobacteria bacterium endosymbiont of Tiliacea citrago]|uniref:chromosomal replication initiator protein DnaA n=1 Tax=Alphaproteobacteria bacterium endosymbiont of Tiliacea citrago TaxID=3077944 RepID=UPI00313E29E6